MKKEGKRPQPQGPSRLQESDEEEEQQRLQVRPVPINCGVYRAIVRFGTSQEHQRLHLLPFLLRYRSFHPQRDQSVEQSRSSGEPLLNGPTSQCKDCPAG